MVTRTEVGVLALQGSFEPHRRTLELVGAPAREVRRQEELEGLTHLVLPGGESTTMHRLLTLFELWDPIVERARAGELALFGTCAGAILVGRSEDEAPPRMSLLDACVRRNAYGSQVHSFRREIRLDALGASFPCVFIRAPKFVAPGPGARVLASDGEEPILLASTAGARVLAASFHPELTGDTRVHALFLAM